jgi:hypothetical protein
LKADAIVRLFLLPLPPTGKALGLVGFWHLGLPDEQLAAGRRQRHDKFIVT